MIARCFQITPLANQSTIWLPTSTGLEKKNGGSQVRPKIGTVDSNCHKARPTTATSTCKASSITRDMVAIPGLPSPLRGGVGGGGSHK